MRTSTLLIGMEELHPADGFGLIETNPALGGRSAEGRGEMHGQRCSDRL